VQPAVHPSPIFLALMVVPEKVQCSVDHQCVELALESMTYRAGVPGRYLRTDDHISEQDALVLLVFHHRKRQNVGRVVGPGVPRIELANVIGGHKEDGNLDVVVNVLDLKHMSRERTKSFFVNGTILLVCYKDVH
jgi:hypothetical protein